MKTLERNRPKLLNSKSYGLSKEYMWSLARTKVIRDLGYTPPKSEIHALLYEHEKSLGDVFVSLVLTERLVNWQTEGDQKIGLRYDRLFQIDERKFYVERETGSQGKDKLRTKLRRYQAHYQKTHESFHVLVLAEEAELYLSIFEELRLSSHYGVAIFSDFIKDPLNTEINTRFGVSNLLSNTAVNE